MNLRPKTKDKRPKYKPRLIKSSALVFCLWSSVLIAGCTTYNAATGRSEFIAISTSDEVSMGQSVHATLQKNNKFVEDERAARVRAIGARVAQVSDRQDYKYNFYLIDSKDLNAFTTPGGNIYIYTGLMEKLTRDDQIAGVLAHEVGHCAAKHTVKKFQAALGYDLISQVALTILDAKTGAGRLASLSSSAVMSLVFSAYGRRDEHEADRLGVKYLYLSGYDMNGMVEVLEVLTKESKKDNVPVMLRSHPLTEDRVTAVKADIEAVKQKFGQPAPAR